MPSPACLAAICNDSFPFNSAKFCGLSRPRRSPKLRSIASRIATLSETVKSFLTSFSAYSPPIIRRFSGLLFCGCKKLTPRPVVELYACGFLPAPGPGRAGLRRFLRSAGPGVALLNLGCLGRCHRQVFNRVGIDQLTVYPLIASITNLTIGRV